MNGGQLTFKGREARRPLGPLPDGARLKEGIGNPGPRRGGIGLTEKRPALRGLLAVGGQQGDVDAVHRGAAHHAECRQEFRHVRFSARSPATLHRTTRMSKFSSEFLRVLDERGYVY